MNIWRFEIWYGLCIDVHLNSVAMGKEIPPWVVVYLLSVRDRENDSPSSYLIILSYLMPELVAKTMPRSHILLLKPYVIIIGIFGRWLGYRYSCCQEVVPGEKRDLEGMYSFWASLSTCSASCLPWGEQLIVWYAPVPWHPAWDPDGCRLKHEPR